MDGMRRDCEVGDRVLVRIGWCAQEAEVLVVETFPRGGRWLRLRTIEGQVRIVPQRDVERVLAPARRLVDVVTGTPAEVVAHYQQLAASEARPA